ncbi:MAG: hypothetical protein H7A25_04610 [Leptospiraceae bacterium]|nr:hypothetical protein [Leptospiraceae bacterium]MCP5499158.1 hypothetical protein [Leptospiraceae bacterium]
MKKLILIIVLIFMPNFLLSKEVIGNKELSHSELGPYGQEVERQTYKSFLTIGLDGFKLTTVNLGYNLNSFFSLGVSYNFHYNGGWDMGTYDFGTMDKGIITYAETYQQDYGKTQGVPDMNLNAFLHFYPFIQDNYPYYISAYLGRTRKSKVILSSLNTVFVSPAIFGTEEYGYPVLSMTAELLPTFYYGLGLGGKFLLPFGLTVGIEFGLVSLHKPAFDPNIKLAYPDPGYISPERFWILHEQLRYAVRPPGTIKLNYAFLIGISI